MLTKTAALELGGQGIRVNAILPGLVQTPLTTSTAENEALQADFDGKIVLSRAGTSAEIAKPMLFLASDDAAYIDAPRWSSTADGTSPGTRPCRSTWGDAPTVA